MRFDETPQETLASQQTTSNSNRTAKGDILSTSRGDRCFSVFLRLGHVVGYLNPRTFEARVWYWVVKYSICRMDQTLANHHQQLVV